MGPSSKRVKKGLGATFFIQFESFLAHADVLGMKSKAHYPVTYT
jgi:hypothetical protein